jgi:hypothetical protein
VTLIASTIHMDCISTQLPMYLFSAIPHDEARRSLAPLTGVVQCVTRANQVRDATRSHHQATVRHTSHKENRSMRQLSAFYI